MDARLKRRNPLPPPSSEDIGAIWFLELEIAIRADDLDAAQAAQAELGRLGWDVRRRPRLVGGPEA